jgi:hypothetical protein
MLLVYLFFVLKTLFLSCDSAYTAAAAATSPLDWNFMTFATQPDSGFLSTLRVRNFDNTIGVVVAFENARSTAASGDRSNHDEDAAGITWIGSNDAGFQKITDGGNLLWSKQTSLLYSSPPSRLSSDTAMICYAYGVNQKAEEGVCGVVMFGGQTTGGKPLSDTWLYRQTPAGKYWFSEILKMQVPVRYGTLQLFTTTCFALVHHLSVFDSRRLELEILSYILYHILVQYIRLTLSFSSLFLCFSSLLFFVLFPL